MSDLQNYIDERKGRDNEFSEDFDAGYREFKLGVLLKEERVKAGISQEELARKAHTTKSAICRLEKRMKDMKLSTLERVAHALGKEVEIQLR
jgi:HTH-type transcriptional regulator / antitoxin HipB